MFYTSTRDKSIKVTSSQAISHGISAEGGLFVPEEIPHITMDDIVRLADCDYIERAKEIHSISLNAQVGPFHSSRISTPFVNV